MKRSIYSIALTLILASVLSESFGKGIKSKTKTPAKSSLIALKSKTDSLSKAAQATSSKVDSLGKEVGENREKTNTLSTVIDSAKKKNDSLTKIKSKDTTNAMAQYKGKTYVFDKGIKIKECNYVGETSEKLTTATIAGTKFTVVGIKNGDLIISFWIWGLPKLPHIDSSQLKAADLAAEINSVDTRGSEKKLYTKLQIIAKRKKFNFKEYAEKQFAPASLHIDSVNDNLRYFLLPKDSLKNSCSEYKGQQDWDITFGVLTTPFKLRLSKFSFTNNLSIGTAVYYQKKFRTNWSWGIVGGLSLSSVTLDAASTNIYPDGTTRDNVAAANRTPITNSSTRPAFTPSFSGLITYKNISFTLGLGADYINKPTNIATSANPESGWIYNGKPWIGIGFGVSLFNDTKPAKTAGDDTQKSAGQ